MQVIELYKFAKQEFQAVYKIMEEAFPAEEIRSYKNGLEQLGHANYRILGSKDRDNKIEGFIAEWDFKTLYFLEHFAIDRLNRGLGVGSRIMGSYLKQSDKPVIIEVEDNKSGLGIRRINFYQRLGFYLSEFGYNQPIVRGDKNKKIPLRLMTYPDPLTEEEFIAFKDQVFDMIYQTDE